MACKNFFKENSVKILVTGASGQLGHDVCRELDQRGVFYLGTDSKKMDLTNRDAVMKQVKEYFPDTIIHCAAYTRVDLAEDEKELAFSINADGTRYLAEACFEIGAKMLYISTDYVFPGTGNEFYKTNDKTEPLNIYGKSKLQGEKYVQEILEKYFIVRISWVFGSRGNNFVKTMLRLAESSQEVNVVADQIGSPTYTADLAPLLCDMVDTDKYGIYHASNEGICSWAEFAEEIFRYVKRPITVHHILTRDYPTKAKRPLNSRMDKCSLIEAGFSRLPHWKCALKKFMGELIHETDVN